MIAQELHVSTINQNPSTSLLLHVFFTTKRSEAPILRDDDLLTTGELVLRATQSFEGGGTI